MKKTKIGSVAAASPVESGGERGDDLLAKVRKTTTAVGMEVVTYPELIWDAAAALKARDTFKRENVNSLVIMDTTWVTDSMKYIFTTKLQVSTVFWAAPYTETFSIGCTQHYGSILKAMGYTYDYVYGLSEDQAVIEGIESYVKVGAAVDNAKDMVIGLMRPKQTWRVCGPQDMSKEGWDLIKKAGVTSVHTEVEEMTDHAAVTSDEEAEKTLAELMKRSGKSVAGKKALVYMAKVYMTTEEIIAKYHFTLVVAKCYPNYGGLMNLAPSWMADESVLVDTEGDLGYASAINTLNQLAGGGVATPGEAGSIDVERNIVPVAYEGSTAVSLADSLDRAQISPSGELDTFVGVPYEAMDIVTVNAIVGSGGDYKMFVTKDRALSVAHEEWVEGGSKLLANLQFDTPVQSVIGQLIRGGMDHHFVIKEGDYTKELSALCDYMGLDQLLLKQVFCKGVRPEAYQEKDGRSGNVTAVVLQRGGEIARPRI